MRVGGADFRYRSGTKLLEGWLVQALQMEIQRHDGGWVAALKRLSLEQKRRWMMEGAVELMVVGQKFGDDGQKQRKRLVCERTGVMTFDGGAEADGGK